MDKIKSLLKELIDQFNTFETEEDQTEIQMMVIMTLEFIVSTMHENRTTDNPGNIYTLTLHVFLKEFTGLFNDFNAEKSLDKAKILLNRLVSEEE